jgi:D-serine deaminase-like pyridoxal phosphate-dependent protein
VDLSRVERNARRMAEHTRRLGVRLRPHTKTHKCVEAARLQVEGHSGGVTVSTLAEARALAEAGFRDITYAVALPLDRLDDCERLHRDLDGFHLLLDHPRTLAELERSGSARGLRWSVLLKVDSGAHRTGVDPAGDRSVSLASALHESPEVDFRGILTHAGQSYQCRSAAEAAEIVNHERTLMVDFADRLRGAGITVDEISIGSTPGVMAATALEGVTEVRPGNYIFFDATQAAIGSCSIDALAFSVLATVIGVYPERREAVINAGALALSKDPGPTHVNPQCGCGVLVDPDGQQLIAGHTIVSLSQEHGVIRSDRDLDPSWLPGTRLRIFPNHSCLAAACFDRYHIVRGTEVVDEWHPVRGW